MRIFICTNVWSYKAQQRLFLEINYARNKNNITSQQEFNQLFQLKLISQFT